LIEALAHRYGLDRSAEGRLATLLEVLASDRLAPTSVRDRTRVAEDHLADSLVALDLPEVRSAAEVADIGSGAGLPGLPLAIALQETEVYLVESNGRKCQFISKLVAACELSNANVVNARAEAWPEGRQKFDLVTARALAPLAVVAEYGAPLLKLGGTLVVWRGRRDPVDERAALFAADELGFEMPDAIAVNPYPGAANRHLQRLIKRAPTPERFPRRPGIARKRPLGGGVAPTSDRRRR
jgi:16S rRNA (guanine527-N7)-methyltransferase